MRLLTKGLLLTLLLSSRASAGEWGASAGYNNPPGSPIGVNFMYAWSRIAVEFGVGSMAAKSDEESSGTAIGGDVDLKLLFGSQWRGFGELGWRVGLGASTGDGLSAGAGNAFAGGGVFYWGSKFFFYAKGDIDLDDLAAAELGKAFPSVGVGLKF